MNLTDEQREKWNAILSDALAWDVRYPFLMTFLDRMYPDFHKELLEIEEQLKNAS